MIKAKFKKRFLKAVIINPPVWRTQPWLHPTMMLLAAACFEQAGMEVRVIDALGENLGWKGLYRELEDFQPQVAMFLTSTPVVYPMMYAAHLTRQACPDCLNIAGGPHFAYLPELSLRTCSDFDLAFYGDPLGVLMDIGRLFEVEDFDFRKLKGSCYLTEDGTFVRNERDEPYLKLENLPMPAYHLTDSRRWFKPLIGGEQGVTLLTSWGCPHNCLFCFTTGPDWWGRKWRGYGALQMADEVEYLYRYHNKRIFWFYDNDFFFDRQRACEFSEEIIRRRLEIRYWVQTRADTMLRDADYIKLYKRGGFSWSLIGYEAINQNQLDRYEKHLSFDKTLASIELLKQNAIMIQGMFLFGDRADNNDSYRDLIEFCDRYADTLFYSFHAPIPFPGSRLFDLALTEGRIEELNFSRWDFHLPVMSTDHLTRKEVKKRLNKIKKRYARRGNYLNFARYLEYHERMDLLFNGLECHFHSNYPIFYSNRAYSRYHRQILNRQFEIMKNNPDWQPSLIKHHGLKGETL